MFLAVMIDSTLAFPSDDRQAGISSAKAAPDTRRSRNNALTTLLSKPDIPCSLSILPDLDKLPAIGLFQVLKICFCHTDPDHFQVDIPVVQPDHADHSPVTIDGDNINANMFHIDHGG
jgi:hypothetical protein